MDFWGIYCFSNKWFMDNFPPLSDNHINIQIEREKQYAIDKELYENKEYNIDNYNEDEYNYNNDEYNYENDYFSDTQSSSDSEYDDYEYI
jgi:hypothetical protein